VLLPLLALYLLILYGYGIKIILSWNWPEGIVSYLIMVVSVIGILTILLIHPYAKQAENQWIRMVSKGYYILLLPLMALLYMAIGMRLTDYGFTVNRYFILATGIWITVVCIYFVSGRTNIKFVPISLAAFLLFISFGPWSVFSVSERSQVNRLEAVLINGNIITNGKVFEEVLWVKDSLPKFSSPYENKHDGLLNDSLHNEVYSILSYLNSYHGMNLIKHWYEQPLDSMITVAEKNTSGGRIYFSEANVYMRTLGLPHQFKWKSDSDGKYFTYSSRTNQKLDVRGFDQLIYLGQFYFFPHYNPERNSSAAVNRTLEIGDTQYNIAYAPLESDFLQIATAKDTIYFSLGQRIRQLTSQYKNESERNIPAPSLRLDTIHHQKNYRLILDEVSFMSKEETFTIQRISGKLLIGNIR
jgi:hypothetical protein